MKILKIFLIILIPVLGTVGCQKSEIKPACPGNTTTATATDDKQSSDRITELPKTSDDDKGTAIVGSGDDDRDGGDKKLKKITR